MNTREFTPSINAQGKTEEPTLTPINAQLILKQHAKAERLAKQAAINYRKPKGFTAKVENYRYKVGPQDVLSIQIWNHPQFSSTSSAGKTENANSVGITVDGAGNIFYPYIGEVKVAGLNTNHIRKLLTKKLSAYLKDPQISVTVVGFNSQVVDVTGAVANPELVPLSNVPLTVLSAVSKAGSAIPCVSNKEGSSGQCGDVGHVQVTHDGITSSVDLNTLKAPNGTSTNWVLQKGDKVYVPNNNYYHVFLMGAVNGPGTYNMINGKLSLKELFGFAGGMGQGSDPTYTYVIRNYKNHPKVFVMNLRSPDALNLAGQFALKPEDVVFVSTSKIQSFNEIINQFTPSLSAVAYIRALDR